ncbi:thioredoxin-like protein, partial [Auriscalpium vulgare]
QTFDKVTTATARNERVVLVDFYADWCGPCKMLSPVLEQLTADPTVASGSGRPLDLVTVNTDEQVALAAKFKACLPALRVSSIPTVVAFKDGQPVSQFVGALNEPGVRRFLASI